MKQIIISSLMITAAIIWISCTNSDSHYIDLQTGKRVTLMQDPATGVMVESDTKRPVYNYVDTRTNDTIIGDPDMVTYRNQQVGGYPAVVNGSNRVTVIDERGNVIPGESQTIVTHTTHYKIRRVPEHVKIKIKDGKYKVKRD
jgi:hypothetical protein